MKPTAQAEFDAFSRSVSAKVGVAVVTADYEAMSFGAWSAGVAWSTIKVPLAVAASRGGVANIEQLRAMISRSDNATAEQLWSRLGDSAGQLVQSVIRDAGDPSTVVESRCLRAEYTPFGQTRWSLCDQARFAAGLPRVAGAAGVLDMMGSLSTDHRWGLAAKGFAAKGGWGPGLDGDYLVRQFGIVPGEIGVALAAEVTGGGHSAAVDTIDALADWVVGQGLAEH